MRPFSSIRSRLILLVLLVIVPLTIFFYLHARGMRHHAVERARGEASKLMKIAVIREEEIIRGTQQILSTLVEIPVVVQGGKGCNEFLARFRKNYPQYLDFGVIRSDGLVIGSATPLEKPVNASGRLYFQETLRNRAFTIGQYQVGLVTGKPSLNFGYPVFDKEGKVSAVVIAAMDLSYVTKFEYEIDIQTPANSTYVTLDRNGAVLTSYPANQLFGRGNPLEKSLFEKISKEMRGTFEAVGADGVKRLYLFSAFSSTLHKEDAYVLLGIPTSTLFMESDKELLRNLSILVVVTLLALILAWVGGNFLIVRPVRILADASKRLASGDFTARSELPPIYGELSELGRVFDEMAGKLERVQDESRRMLKVAEEKQELGNRLHSLTNNVPGMVYRGHRDWSLSFVGAEVKQVTGHTAEEFTSGAVNWKSIIHPDDREWLKEYFRNAVKDQLQTLRVEYRIQHKHGDIRWVTDSRQMMYDETGSFEYVDGLIIDVTERKKVEKALTRLGMAVDQAAEMVIVTDTEGNVEYVNPSFERITGYSREEAVGRNMRILKSGKQGERFYKEMWTTISRGEVWEGRFVNRKKDGTLYDEEATISPVRDASGKIVNFVAGKRDVTQEVVLQKQVQTAQRMESVGTLAGGIAHDFNNALTGVLGFGEMLKHRLVDDPKASADLNQILRSAERASTLTRQLLAFARQQVIEPVNLNLSIVVLDLSNLLRKVIGEHIEIKSSLQEDLPSVFADPGQMEQVLMNLCLNARDAMPSGGQLLIGTDAVTVDAEQVKAQPYMKEGRYVLLTVSDTGIGMDEKTIERIFEPFFTSKGPEKGTGLGLAVVYGIVKQHNGFIHVSSNLGIGTTFEIRLPVVDAKPDARAEAKDEPVRGGNETILLAEDDESVRMLAERTLKECGYRVLAARNGEDAVGVFRQSAGDIKLAILDVVMPKKGGKEAFEEMHAANPALKVIYTSGYAANAVHESFVLHAGVPILQKPFGPRSLARKVREVLDSN
jgi:PAS domain S-box-containing protein